MQAHALERERSLRAITLGSARRRQLRVRSRTGIDTDGEPVSTDHAARRMDDHALADTLPFRVERLLHHQRPDVRARRQQRPLTHAPVAKIEAGAPSIAGWRRIPVAGVGRQVGEVGHKPECILKAARNVPRTGTARSAPAKGAQSACTAASLTQPDVFVFNRQIIDAALRRGDPSCHLSWVDHALHEAADECAVGARR